MSRLLSDYHDAKQCYKALATDRRARRQERVLAGHGNQRAGSEENEALTHNWEVHGICRPVEKSIELDLCLGLKDQLTESIRLCGLRQVREKKILDMIDILCNQLLNKDIEIKTWAAFADSAAASAADNSNFRSRFCESLKTTHKQALKMSGEMLSLREDTEQFLLEFAEMIQHSRNQIDHNLSLRHKIVKSEWKTKVDKSISHLVRLHEGEKQQLEAMVYSHKFSNELEESKSNFLCSQIGYIIKSFKVEKNNLELKIADASNTANKAKHDLLEAKNKISYLETLLENEKMQRTSEVSVLEEKMARELDDIESKIKRSITAIVEQKNKEIETASKRTESAEALARKANKVLFELQESVLVSTAAAEKSSET